MLLNGLDGAVAGKRKLLLLPINRSMEDRIVSLKTKIDIKLDVVKAIDKNKIGTSLILDKRNLSYKWGEK